MQPNWTRTRSRNAATFTTIVAVLVAIIVSSTDCGGIGTDGTEPESIPGVLVGYVVTRSGEPVAGARITYTESQPSILGSECLPPLRKVFAEVRTDENGEFQVDRPIEDGRIVQVHTEQYVDLVSAPLPAGSRNITLTLEPGASVIGRVLSVPACSPVSGIEIRASSSKDYKSAVSASGGGFTLRGMNDGEYTLDLRDFDSWALVGQFPRVRLDGGRTADSPILYVRRVGAVKGRVYDVDTGDGVEAVQLTCDRISSVSNRDGTYSLNPVAEGRHTVSCSTFVGSGVRVAKDATTVDIIAGSTQTLDIPVKKIARSLALRYDDFYRTRGRAINRFGARGSGALSGEPQGVIEGRVISALTGLPVAEYGLAIEIQRGAVYGSQDSLASWYQPDGTFRVDRIPAGEVTVSACTAESLVATEVVALSAAETNRDVVLRLKPGAPLSGVVTGPDGAVVEDVGIAIGSLPARDRDIFYYDDITDFLGVYRLQPLPPGPTTVFAFHPDFELWQSTVQLNSDAPTVVNIHLKAK